MSLLQPALQLQHTTELLPSVQEEIQFWVDKAVAWGQADSPDTQRDTSLHLRRLSSYLQELLTHINNVVSIDLILHYISQIPVYLMLDILQTQHPLPNEIN